MNTLERILSSKVRAAIFTLLFGVEDRELHTRELARQTDFAEPSIRQELKNLLDIGLLDSHRDGNRRYYKADKSHPLYPDIQQLVIKTTGLPTLLRAALNDNDIICAFVFGSFTTGKQKADSDIDLVVIGEISLRQLTTLLRNSTELSGREINPHVLTPSEYNGRRKKKDHFVTHVIAGKKIFMKGTQHDLDTMAEQQLADN